MINCKILGEQVSVKDLTFVEFGFGKANRAETFKYEIKIPIEDFCNESAHPDTLLPFTPQI